MASEETIGPADAAEAAANVFFATAMASNASGRKHRGPKMAAPEDLMPSRAFVGASKDAVVGTGKSKGQ